MANVWKKFVCCVAVEVAKICPRCVCVDFQKIVRQLERMETNQQLTHEAYLEKSKSGAYLQKAAVACSAASLGFVAYDHLVLQKKYEECEEMLGVADVSRTASAGAAAAGAAASASASGSGAS